MTRNFRLFLGASIIFYLVGVMNDAAAVYVLSGICLAVVGGCYWLSRLAVAGLDLMVRLPRAEVQAHAKTPVQLILSNIGLISRPGPVVRLQITNQSIPGLTRSYDVALPPLAAGAAAEATVEIALPARGRWQIGPARIVGTDPLGMFVRPGPGSNDLPLLAFPEMFEVPWAWRRDLLSPAARHMARTRTRHGGEFSGIRPHEPGDDLRHVHWKVTAHRGDMVVKEYSRGRELSAALWLDLNSANVAGSGAESSLEYSLSMAASLIPALIHMDQAVAVAGNGLPLPLASPGRGEATALRAVRALAEVHATSGRPFGALLTEYSREARPGLTAIVITSGLEPGLEQPLLAAAARGIALRCLLLAPENALTPEQRARQSHLAERLAGSGIPAAVARSRQDLPHALGRLAEQDPALKAVVG